MTENISKEEKLQYDALFNPEELKNLESTMKFEQHMSDFTKSQATQSEDAVKYFQQKDAELKNETSSMNHLSYILDMVQRTDPQLAKQAEKYLSDIINKDWEFSSKYSRDREKNKEVDLDGSKRGFWGKLKNKAKNFLKPHNNKNMLESAIADFKKQAMENYETFDWLKRCARPADKANDSSVKISFSQLFSKTKEISSRYNADRSRSIVNKERSLQASEHYNKSAQTNQQNIDKINEIRDKAAKEIELRSTARDTTGIKDTQSNTGVDRLADKAKAMEGMTPEQRLAYRISQMRGTSKEEAKPVVKREIDSKVMDKALEGKMRA